VKHLFVCNNQCIPKQLISDLSLMQLRSNMFDVHGECVRRKRNFIIKKKHAVTLR